MRTKAQLRKALRKLAEERKLSWWCSHYEIPRRTAYRVMNGEGMPNRTTLWAIDLALPYR